MNHTTHKNTPGFPTLRTLLQYSPWLLLLLGLDAFAALLLWLADADAFLAMASMIVLFSLLLFAAVCCVLIRHERKRSRAFYDFLDNPDEYHESVLQKNVSAAQHDAVHALGDALRAEQLARAALQTQLNEYEEYVETWAHETKTPLSLLALLLDNRREEFSPAVRFKLDYIQNRTQESVGQMLFYARLKSARKDYLFEQIQLSTCIEEVLDDYRPLLDEKQFRLSFSLPEDTVYADRRGLAFLLGQIISNSIKYCQGPAEHISMSPNYDQETTEHTPASSNHCQGTAEQTSASSNYHLGAADHTFTPELSFTSFRHDGRLVLSIRDNGIGIRSCDLPYIFEKGFTGDSGDNRKKATGMGLYLAKELAEQMSLRLDAASQWGHGTELQISFPIHQAQTSTLPPTDMLYGE